MADKPMSLRGTKQSVGLMQLSLNASAHKLTDCFVPRNDRVDGFPKMKQNDKLMSLRGTKQSVGLMQLILNVFARKLTDWFNETPIRASQ